LESPVEVEDALGLKLGLVLIIIDLLEDILEATIILLQDSILLMDMPQEVK